MMREYEVKDPQIPAIRINMASSAGLKFLNLMNHRMFMQSLDIQYNQPNEEFSTPPNHLCIVLDRSTSMKGERLDSVRENLKAVHHCIKIHRFDIDCYL